eukprot:scaffold38517_cov48-Phaeocystis_antarctica.AAC.1
MKTSRGGGTAPPAAPWTASSARIDTAACSAHATCGAHAVCTAHVMCMRCACRAALRCMCMYVHCMCMCMCMCTACALHVHARGRLLRGAEVRVVGGEGGAVCLAKAEEGQVAARGLAAHCPYTRGRQRLLEHL